MQEEILIQNLEQAIQVAERAGYVHPLVGFVGALGGGYFCREFIAVSLLRRRKRQSGRE